jgi:hypothetical protein
MKFTKTFYIKLILLILPVVGLFLWPFLQSKSNSIGGGSYDLTKLYAGIYILIFTVFWIIAIFISLILNSYNKKKEQLSEDKSLIVFGLIVFTSSFIILANTWIS